MYYLGIDVHKRNSQVAVLDDAGDLVGEQHIDNDQLDELAVAYEGAKAAFEASGVKYLNYWVDDDEGAVFCLFEGPSKEAGEKVHQEAHGLTADEIYEVEQGE